MPGSPARLQSESGRARIAMVAVLALVAALAAAFGSTAAAAPSAASRAGGHAVPHSVKQVYHPGSDTLPSTPVTRCTPRHHPKGCYKGPLLTLQGAHVGNTAAEPTIGVAPDGTGYFAAGKLVIDTSTVWGVAATDTRKSTDGGLTWTSIQNKVPGAGVGIPPGNADPMIYVDPTTGRVFNFDLTAACNYLSYSDDKGASWTTNPVACGNVPVDHQTIAAGKPRAPLTTVLYPNIVYWCSNRVVDSTCGRSLDGGISWSPAGDAYGPNDACGGLTGHLAADPDGRIFLPTGNCANPWISISSDDGTTWTPVKVSSLSSGFSHTSVASDSAGNLYYVWIDNAQRPFLSYSKDHGMTWSTPVMVAPPGVVQANFPVVAAGNPGKVAISFPSATVANGSWNQTVTVSTDVFDAKPFFVSATGNDPADPIHKGPCFGRCDGIWDFIDVHISKAGQAWTSTSDDCTGACTSSDHIGQGIAIRQIGGPNLGPGVN